MGGLFFAEEAVRTVSRIRFAQAERFRAINAKDMDKLADKYPRLKDKVTDIKRSALIFPFKASQYLVDELIDWDMAGAYLGVLRCYATRLHERRRGVVFSSVLRPSPRLSQGSRAGVDARFNKWRSGRDSGGLPERDGGLSAREPRAR